VSGKPRNVFISYSHADVQFVSDLTHVLVLLDVQFWRDSKDVAIGANIPKSVYDGIKSASHFCCVISKSSISSRWVEEELSFAKMRQMTDPSLAIVPLLIDAVVVPDYVLAYRCAHLEDRNLSLSNPEFALTLDAFGVTLPSGPPLVVIGDEAERLLDKCSALAKDVFELHQALVHIDGIWQGYRRDKNVSDFNSNPFYAEETAKSEAAIPRVFERYEELGRRAGSSVHETMALADKVGLNPAHWPKSLPSELRPELWIAFDLAMDQVRAIAKELAYPAKSPSTLRFLCSPDKLQRWLGQIVSAKAVVGNVLGMLRTWTRKPPAP